tara:strand:- start:7125 stop:7430 length:306 start_codon:yes stop_codon:yes gene_type:complete
MNGSKLMTLWMAFLWLVFLPIVPFISKSNCWYYSIWRWVSSGFKGKIVPVQSRRWRGYHCVYVDEHGIPWEYTMKKLPRFMPWWQFILYDGIVRRYRGKIE